MSTGKFGICLGWLELGGEWDGRQRQGRWRVRAWRGGLRWKGMVYKSDGREEGRLKAALRG